MFFSKPAAAHIEAMYFFESWFLSQLEHSCTMVYPACTSFEATGGNNHYPLHYLETLKGRHLVDIPNNLDKNLDRHTMF